MEYNKPLLKCICKKYPKLEMGDLGYVRYICNKCSLMTFFSKNENTAKELFNSQILNIKNLKVRI